jgi:hypothetical protein
MLQLFRIIFYKMIISSYLRNRFCAPFAYISNLSHYTMQFKHKKSFQSFHPSSRKGLAVILIRNLQLWPNTQRIYSLRPVLTALSPFKRFPKISAPVAPSCELLSWKKKSLNNEPSKPTVQLPTDARIMQLTCWSNAHPTLPGSEACGVF